MRAERLTAAESVDALARRVYPLTYFSHSRAEEIARFFAEHFGPTVYAGPVRVCREFAASRGAAKRPVRDWRCMTLGELAEWVERAKPLNLYYGPLFAGRGATRTYVYRELVFEADAPLQTPRAAALVALPILESLPGLGVEEVLVTYSGGRSLHIHVLAPKWLGLLTAEARKRLAARLPSVADAAVTGDVARLMRVPLSIHGGTLRVVEPICRGGPRGCIDIINSML